MPVHPFLQQLLSLPLVDYALLSPDGRWVAFTWYRLHSNTDVFLLPSDGSSPPLALTHTPEATRLVSWSADSHAVLVSEDHGGDEHARLFRIDLEINPGGGVSPGTPIPLTEDRPPYFLRGGSLAPDSSTLYYGANYDFTSACPIEPTWIYRHDLRSGQRLPIAQPTRPCHTTPELNRPGTHLIYARKDRHPSGRQYYLVDVLGLEDRQILNFGDQVKVFARWFPDGERILVLSEATEPGRQQDHTSLGIYHWPTGALRWLVDDPGREIEGAWVSPEGLVIVDEIVQARHHPSWIDPATGIETAFPALPGNLVPLGCAPDGAWIALYYSSTWPVELVRFDDHARSPSDLVSLTQVWQRTPLHQAQLTPGEDFHWTAPDGLQIQGWLYRAGPDCRRAVIQIHGGPTYHIDDSLIAQAQYLVSQGFNVLYPNYRGSTGFGLKFRERIKEDGWGGREQEDIAAGAQALIAAGLAEPGKIGIFGVSYGGYSSWCQVTRYPLDLVAAAAPICGMTDLVVDYETTRPDLRPYSEEMLGGSPSQVPERYHARSPINFVQNIRARLLIVQGALDPNVTPENVRQVVQRLDARAIPYELLVFDDEGHGIYKPANQAILFTRLAEFFDAAMG